MARKSKVLSKTKSSASKGSKRNANKDFTKVKNKVGKSKKAAINETKTDFKVKKVQLPSQSALDEKGEEVTHRRQTRMARPCGRCIWALDDWMALGFLPGWVLQSCPGTRSVFTSFLLLQNHSCDRETVTKRPRQGLPTFSIIAPKCGAMRALPMLQLSLTTI
ncbi:unnamed protein product [Symbiodinium sp. CCMP2456]|nr:unnamed protein product [Symbiodinium sp. CCMP2456]